MPGPPASATTRRGADAERADHLHALIVLGIDRGYVTHGDIADTLPDETIERADVDAAASRLREHAGAHAAWTLVRHFAQDTSALENPAILEQLNHSM